MEWIPTNILDDVILGKIKNKSLKDKKPIPFAPIPYNKKGILWWHIPEFLEDNTANEPATTLTEGTTICSSRRDKLAYFFENEIYPYINAHYEGDTWSDSNLKGDARYDFFNKITYLAGSSCNGRMGNHISGLYLDFEKFKDLFKLDLSEAEKIIDNNLFLGNIASIYSAAVESLDGQKKCDEIKKLYKKTLNMISSSDVHFKARYDVQEKLTFEIEELIDNPALKNKIKKLDYKDLLDEHIEAVEVEEIKRDIKETRLQTNNSKRKFTK